MRAGDDEAGLRFEGVDQRQDLVDEEQHGIDVRSVTVTAEEAEVPARGEVRLGALVLEHEGPDDAFGSRHGRRKQVPLEGGVGDRAVRTGDEAEFTDPHRVRFTQGGAVLLQPGFALHAQEMQIHVVEQNGRLWGMAPDCVYHLLEDRDTIDEHDIEAPAVTAHVFVEILFVGRVGDLDAHAHEFRGIFRLEQEVLLRHEMRLVAQTAEQAERKGGGHRAGILARRGNSGIDDQGTLLHATLAFEKRRFRVRAMRGQAVAPALVQLASVADLVGLDARAGIGPGRAALVVDDAGLRLKPHLVARGADTHGKVGILAVGGGEMHVEAAERSEQG